MKKTQKQILLLALCTGVAFGLSACQPSPEKEVVVGKESMEVLAGTAAPGSPGQETAAPGAVAKSTFQNRYEPSGQLRYVVDAAVTTYDSAMPVFRAKPHAFSAEEVRALSEYFFQGETAYENRSILTKKEVEERILELTQWASDTEGLLACAGNEQAAQERKEEYEKEIEAWKQYYETAPETYQPQECDWQFHPESYFWDERSVTAESSGNSAAPEASWIRASAEVDGRTFEMEATNRTSGTDPSHSFFLTLSWNDEVWNKGGTSGTEEEAIACAAQCLEALGLDGRWEQKDCTRLPVFEGCRDDAPESGYTYTISYQPVYEGYSLSDLPQPTDKDKEGQYAMFYDYELLTITVADNEIIQFSWSNPLEITSVEHAAASELSFDQIMERFGEQMELSYPIDWFRQAGGSQDIEEAEVRISDIQRSFARIRIPDTQMEFYLVPAWSFYGVIGTREGGSDLLTFGYPSVDADGNSFLADPIPHAILALNALDGSVIDIIQGY